MSIHTSSINLKTFFRNTFSFFGFLKKPSLNRIENFNINRRALNLMWSKLADDASELKVLDLNFGNGDNLEIILKKYPKAIVSSLNVNEGDLLKFESFYEKKFPNQISFYKNSLFDFIELNTKFDLIVGSFESSFIEADYEGKFSETIYNLLKPRGKFIYVEQVKISCHFFKQFCNMVSSLTRNITFKINKNLFRESGMNNKPMNENSSRAELCNYFKSKSFKYWHYLTNDDAHSIHIFNPIEF